MDKKEVATEISPSDILVDEYRAGKNRNWVSQTANAVRITHLPTGTVVTSESEPSQHHNKSVAMEKLRKELAHRGDGDAAD